MFGLGGLPFANDLTWYYLRSYGILLLAGAIGSTPLPKLAAQRLCRTKAGVVLEPLFVALMLVLVTACLVDGSFNPFLYFRF